VFNERPLCGAGAPLQYCYCKDSAVVNPNDNCTDTFVENPNQTGGPGEEQPLVLTENLCKDECLKLDECEGFDFNRQTNKCYLFKVKGVISVTPQQNVYFYRRTRCPDNTCVGVYDTMPETRVYGGAEQLGVLSEEDCKFLCVKDDKCLGFDFDNNPNVAFLCYLHYNASKFAVKSPGQGIKHYILMSRSCDQETTLAPVCVDTYNSTDQRGFDGVEKVLSRSLTDCYTECNKDPDCESFDYDPDASRGKCFLFNEKEIKLYPSTGTNVKHYTRNRCSELTTAVTVITSAPTGPVSCPAYLYNVESGTGARGGISQGETTLDACKAACNVDNSCVGFDFTASNTCWLHMNMSNFANKYTDSKVSLYVKDGCEVTGTSTAKPCIPLWAEPLNDTHANGASPQKDAQTLSQCQDLCVLNTLCVALDYNENNREGEKCWLHLQGVNNPAFQQGTKHYTLIDRCPEVTPTSAQCEGVQFQEFPNVISYGGQKQDSIQSVEACKEKCKERTDCVGFDYSFKTPLKCFLHFDLADFNQNRVTDVLDATQYKKAPCDATTVTPAPCDDFKPFLKQNAFGAERNTSVNTEQGCLDACRNNLACTAIDFNVIKAECWIHTANATTLILVSNDDVNHYQKQPCTVAPTTPPLGCDISFVKFPGKFSYSGIDKPELMSVEDCQNECKNNPSCIKFDFVPASTNIRCWIHITESTTFNSTNADQYVKISNCFSTTPSQCVPQWTMQVGFGAIGGIGQVGKLTVDQCKAICLNTTQCVGFDFSTSAAATQTCYTYNDLAVLQAGYPRQDVNQYVLKRCPDFTTVTATPDVCQPLWGAIQNNTNAQGGTWQAGVKTFSACQETCFANQDCVALDFDANNAKNCWLHLNPNNTKVLGVAFGVQHVALISRCYQPGTPTATAPPACVDAFDKLENKGALGATKAVGVYGEQGCKEKCLAEPTCTSFDLDKTTQQCWIHNSPDINVQNREDSDHYTRRQDCVTATTKPCEPYTKMMNSGGDGATIQQGVLGEANCKAACSNQPTLCGSFDLSTEDQSCWFFPPSYNNSLVKSRANVDHYIRNICEETTAVTVTESPCTIQYQELVGQGAFGATQAQGVFGKNNCSQACSSQDDCVAFDLSTNDNSCWLHFNASKAADIGPRDDANHYIKVEVCATTGPACEILYDEFPLKGAFTGKEAPNVSGRDACAVACNANVNCTAFDLGGDASCWLYYYILPTIETRSDTNHYVKKEVCPGTPTALPCIDTFTAMPNKGVDSGVKASVFGRTECEKTCLADSTCVGFDIGSDLSCWLILSIQDVKDRQDGVTHYERIDCKVSAGPCENEWDDQNNRRAFGAEKSEVDVVNLNQCKDQCLRNASCVALDFNPSASDHKCWLFISEDQPTSLYSGITHSVLKVRCPGVIPTTLGPCVDEFVEELVNVHYLGGTRINGIMPLSQCKQACLERWLDPPCLGIDYNVQDQKCFMHTNIDNLHPDNQKERNYINHYRLKRCTTDAPTRPSTSTTTTTTTMPSTTASITPAPATPAPATPAPATPAPATPAPATPAPATPAPATPAPAPQYNPSAFWYASTTDVMPSIVDIRLDRSLVDKNFEYSGSNGRFVAKTNGYFWFHWSAGIKSQRSTSVSLTGSRIPSPIRLYRDSSYHFAATANSVDIISRDYSGYMSVGNELYLRNNGMYAGSDGLGYETSMVGYALSDVIDLWTMVHMSMDVPSIGPAPNSNIAFSRQILIPSQNSNLYKNDYYECTKTGLHIFHVSLGVEGFTSAVANLRIGGTQFEISHGSSNHNGTDIVSRTVFFDCNLNDQVYVTMVSGRAISAGNDYLTSFQGFKVLDTNAPSFYAYRTSSFSPFGNNLQSITYSVTKASSGTLFDGTSFSTTVPGIYHVYFGAGTSVGQAVDMVLVKRSGANAEVSVAKVARTSVVNNGRDYIGRSVLVRMAVGDALSTKLRGGTTAYSDSNHQTGFMAFLVYRD
jgi:hypothetical protein